MFVNALIASCLNFVCPLVLLDYYRGRRLVYIFFGSDFYLSLVLWWSYVEFSSVCVIDNIVVANECLVHVFGSNWIILKIIIRLV